jgi:serine/threonine protein phosphatase PrpC
MTNQYQYVQVSASNREQSEDAAEVFERGDALVLALADGADGIRGGVTASRTLVTAVRSAAKDAAFNVTDARAWADLLRATDATLVKHSGGETTGIVVVLTPNKLVGVSAGDCEAWAIRSKDVVDLTVGQHTHRRLGSGRAVPVTFEHAVLEGVLLVASDGLFKYASMQVIARVVRASPISVAAEQLIELVRLPSGKFHDDMAAVLVARKPAPLLS